MGAQPNTDPEYELMRKIQADYGELIAETVAETKIPPAFVAALIANESGGDAMATRREPNVLLGLFNVLMGRRTEYAGLNRAAIISSLDTAFLHDFVSLDDLACSWGLTQIMGYQVLSAEAQKIVHEPTELTVPEAALRMTALILAHFARLLGLDPAADFEGLFRYWNTGSPTGQTTDRLYVAKGKSRMAIYAALEQPPKAESA